MSYHVRLTETAKQDLREIAYYIADQTRDKEVARNFVNELRVSCNRPTDFPQAGALPKDHVLRSKINSCARKNQHDFTWKNS